MAYITFSKQVEVEGPRGRLAINANEDNIKVATTGGEVTAFDLPDLKRASYGYLARKRGIQRRYHDNGRVLRKAVSKIRGITGIG